MASRPIPSWFDNLPSWIQSGRNSYHDDQGSRVSSLVSASTRTKTKSRAEAMRKLEGRKLSEPTTMASTRGEDSESEDDDPWTDPWQWQRPPGARRSSSVYSEAQELQTMHKYFDEQIQNPFVEEDHAGPGAAGHVKKPFVEDCRERTKPGSQNYTKNPFTEEDNSSSEEFTSAEAKQQDLGFQVRNALRQSYTTDLTHPPKAYSVLSRRFSLTPSDSPYRLSWLHSCPDDEYAKAHGLWRGASRSFDPDLRSERSAKEAEAARYLGWRFETVEAPKSVYQSSVESKLSSCPSRSVYPCLRRHDSSQLRTIEAALSEMVALSHARTSERVWLKGELLIIN
ncbi:hypothetical protein HII31_10631 [Pseudocercospora fuligena]|uniref:Uncharacterized protein n=1 Tax=Pseudocercospora fuligena TaxID=685502 RepID=A0A8H6RBS9_9PEZI|nr:hypothetical protein HII31_10631 [Pseudocercospora fuligena]